MDLDVEYEFENEQQFWNELEETVSQQCDTHELIDDALRSYLSLVINCRGKYIDSDYDLGRCSWELARSPLFVNHADYVRRQFVHCLLQEEESNVLFVATSFLLADARINERTFEMLKDEGAFLRLVGLISSPKSDEEEGLHRLLMELFYEMARIQKISLDNLASVDDDFVCRLFDIIENVSGDVNDPYHYPVIRVLLVLNEQFMVAAHDPDNGKNSVPLTNKVIKVLAMQGSKYKTFGENIILLLNREDETSLQLLTLKLLYLIFTTPSTYEYFYTNDLRVLVDILIRNLLDLPEGAAALRHTYLRVFYPLLEHTQLQYPPHYKKYEIRKLFIALGGGDVSDPGGNVIAQLWSHFDEVDETTKRLVKRCQGVSWLSEDTEPLARSDSPTESIESAPASPVSPTKPQPPTLPAPRKLKKRNSSKASTLTIGQYLTPQLESARQSSLSMMEVAAQREKPGVITPSRNPSLKQNLRAVIMQKKEKPPPPKARRSTWTRAKMERSATDLVITNTTVTPDETKLEDDPPSPKSPFETNSSPESEETKDESATPVATTISNAALKTSQKKPPPAPKARRWRGKRSKEEDEGGGDENENNPKKLEPGKFDTKLPSIVTTSIDDQVKIVEISNSPFSPPEEKTLSPTITRTDTAKDEPPTFPDNMKEHHRSVSEALNQAQDQAIHDITDTLKRAALTSPDSLENKSHTFHHGGDSTHDTDHPSAHTLTTHQPTLQPRAVLAPPNQAPPRAVPGPTWELERSPFLSDVEEDDDIGGASRKTSVATTNLDVFRNDDNPSEENIPSSLPPTAAERRKNNNVKAEKEDDSESESLSDSSSEADEWNDADDGKD